MNHTIQVYGSYHEDVLDRSVGLLLEEGWEWGRVCCGFMGRRLSALVKNGVEDDGMGRAFFLVFQHVMAVNDKGGAPHCLRVAPPLVVYEICCCRMFRTLRSSVCAGMG